MSARKSYRIGIAVVEYQRQFLIGIRDAHAPLAGFHEFPGGKCEPDESAEQCAVRECLEETGLEVTALQEIRYEEHAYDHADVQLHFWLCQPVETQAVFTDQNLKGFHWIPAKRLLDLRFPEANKSLIELLVNTYASE